MKLVVLCLCVLLKNVRSGQLSFRLKNVISVLKNKQDSAVITTERQYEVIVWVICRGRRCQLITRWDRNICWRDACQECE